MSDPPKRRLPFKPTALRKSKSETPQPDDDDDLALFRRSKMMVPMMAAEAERRVKRERAKEEARKRRSETAERGSEGPPGSAPQKRRAGGEDGRSPSREALSPSSKRRHGDDASPANLGSPTGITKSSTPAPMSSQADTVTILEDDDHDDVPPTNPLADSPLKSSAPRWASGTISGRTTTSPTPVPGSTSVEIIGDSDSETEEPEEVPAPPEEEETDPDLQVFINAARERQRLASQETEPSAESFKVQVESTIPRALIDGKPVSFKLSSTDPLRNLKSTWCTVMQLNHVDVSHSDVFFTWRGRRLYNTTTLRGLGIAAMGNDLLYAGDAGDRRGFSTDRKRVVLEAWTEELYEGHLKEEERERMRRLGEIEEEEEEESAPAEEKLRVTMRARQGEPVKVSATASSTVADLIDKFRAKRDLPADAAVAVYFDGEKLGDDMTLQDADIGDEEQVEVHLS